MILTIAKFPLSSFLTKSTPIPGKGKKRNRPQKKGGKEKEGGGRVVLIHAQPHFLSKETKKKGEGKALTGVEEEGGKKGGKERTGKHITTQYSLPDCSGKKIIEKRIEIKGKEGGGKRPSVSYLLAGFPWKETKEKIEKKRKGRNFLYSILLPRRGGGKEKNGKKEEEKKGEGVSAFHHLSSCWRMEKKAGKRERRRRRKKNEVYSFANAGVFLKEKILEVEGEEKKKKEGGLTFSGYTLYIPCDTARGGKLQEGGLVGGERGREGGKKGGGSHPLSVNHPSRTLRDGFKKKKREQRSWIRKRKGGRVCISFLLSRVSAEGIAEREG